MLSASRLFLGFILVSLLSTGSRGGAELNPEQFLVINVAPGEVKEKVFEEISRLRPESSSSSVTLGIGTIFSYFQRPPAQTDALLKRFLKLSERFNMPIVVQWDGEQWWGNRPDLWNWWDQSKPGYNPENRQNVEWTGWGPEHAVRIGWRNWGRQVRVLPAPNLMAPKYREASHQEMRRLVPIVLDWWNGLPEEKRHLLIGMKVGWESSIGTSTFYYPNGNELADEPEENDPTTGIDDRQLPGRGVTAMGYAAVSTAGLAESGELTEEHLTEVVRRHLEDLSKLAADLGVPRERLFTHGGGWKPGELLYDAAVNRYSCPGWSFYRHAANPAEDKGALRALGKSDAPYWGAVEWLPLNAPTEDDWIRAIKTTLALPRCRYLCIYNWRGIADKPAALQGIRSFLGE